MADILNKPDGSDKSDGSDQSDQSDRSDKSDKSDDPEGAANTMICRIHQATYLLRRQLENLERRFLAEGGFTERLYRMRTDNRSG